MIVTIIKAVGGAECWSRGKRKELTGPGLLCTRHCAAKPLTHLNFICLFFCPLCKLGSIILIVQMRKQIK